MKKIFVAILFLVPLVYVSCKSEKPEKKPNIILIMADDMGFSDMGVMGGEIETPNLNSLSTDGVLYSQFYNEARCCPTRASLLTGLNPHQTGMGWMTALDLGTESYSGEINHKSVTIAEVLKSSGYDTYMVGKWHLTHDENTKQNSDKSSWPVQRGFDHYFGTLLGGGSYYNPESLMEQNTMIKAPADFYYTDAISDTAVNMINGKDKNSPFFMYVAYTAPHWPLHASRSDIESYIDKYSVGWDSIRAMRFNRQKELGIIKEDWLLSEQDPDVPAWISLTDKEKEEMTFRMAVYAAQVEVMDRGIGRIVSALESKGELENTLIFFLQDNGACAEQISGKSKKLEDLGSEKSYESYRLPRANDNFHTIFRSFKHWTHEGGISTPLLVHWPAGIVLPGRVSTRIGQVKDIMATCIEVAGVNYLEEFNNHKIHKLEGESLLQSIKNEGEKRDSDLFWEHEANRAVRSGDWKLVLKASSVFPFDGKWELYNMADDRTETNDLAEVYPEKVKELQKRWENWAQRVNVYPLDNRGWNDRFKNPKAITQKYLESEVVNL